MFNSSTPSLSDIAAVTNGGGLADGGWIWLIIIFVLLFGWGGNGFANGSSNSGAADNYVLASDFASLERQISSGFEANRQQVTSVANGISSLGYDQLNQMNGINTNILTSTNTLQNQLSASCCENKSAIADLNYNLATSNCATNNNINQAMQQIMQNDNANYRALHDEIVSNKIEQKDAQIAAMNQQINALQLTASQSAQNQYLISALRPSPVPAYTVANPYYYGSYGTTIS